MDQNSKFREGVSALGEQISDAQFMQDASALLSRAPPDIELSEASSEKEELVDDGGDKPAPSWADEVDEEQGEMQQEQNEKLPPPVRNDAHAEKSPDRPGKQVDKQGPHPAHEPPNMPRQRAASQDSGHGNVSTPPILSGIFGGSSDQPSKARIRELEIALEAVEKVNRTLTHTVEELSARVVTLESRVDGFETRHDSLKLSVAEYYEEAVSRARSFDAEALAILTEASRVVKSAPEEPPMDINKLTALSSEIEANKDRFSARPPSPVKSNPAARPGYQGVKKFKLSRSE